MSRQLRIAIVFEFGTLSGGEHSMLSVLDRCVGEEFEFVAALPAVGRLADTFRQRGVRHVPLALHDASGKRLSREDTCGELISAVRKVSPDILHANSLAMGRLTGAIAGEAGCRCVAHLRDIIRLSGRAIADLNRNDLLIAVSQATRDYHVAQGLDAARTRVVYNGVDCERFHPRAATGSLKRELQLPADSFLIATIGQIGLRKGQDVLAEAAVLLKDRLPTAHYLLVGTRHSAKAESITFEKNVQARFADAGLPLRDMAGRLHCVGYREDVDRLLNEVDLLVHPAHQEPLGRVLLEAAAAGTPIVATDVGGTGEILEDGRSARLVPPNDPQALADAIIELHDARQLRTRFSTAARERAEALFNIRAASDGLATIWRELISV